MHAMSMNTDSVDHLLAGSVPRSLSTRRSQSAGKPPLAQSYGTAKRPATVGTISGRCGRNGNDLQTYTSMLEHHLHDRRRELIALAAEKRQLEILLMKQKRKTHEQPKYGDLFDGKESLDVPAKLRAIVEDNRALKDKVRRLKTDCAHWHRLSSDLSKQNQLMQAQVKQAKQQVTKCSVTVEEMRQIQDQINRMHEMERQVRLLTSENQILRHKMDADALRLRQERSSARRDQQKLSAEIRKLNSESHTQALQIQYLRSQIKEEQRRVKDLRKQPHRANVPVEATLLTQPQYPPGTYQRGCKPQVRRSSHLVGPPAQDALRSRHSLPVTHDENRAIRIETGGSFRGFNSLEDHNGALPRSGSTKETGNGECGKTLEDIHRTTDMANRSIFAAGSSSASVDGHEPVAVNALTESVAQEACCEQGSCSVSIGGNTIESDLHDCFQPSKPLLLLAEDTERASMADLRGKESTDDKWDIHACMLAASTSREDERVTSTHSVKDAR